MSSSLELPVALSLDTSPSHRRSFPISPNQNGVPHDIERHVHFQDEPQQQHSSKHLGLPNRSNSGSCLNGNSSSNGRRKRSHSFSWGGDHHRGGNSDNAGGGRAKRRRTHHHHPMALSTAQFLLGGNITDPLNLGALEPRNFELNRGSAVPVVIPANINDPLNLDASSDTEEPGAAEPQLASSEDKQAPQQLFDITRRRRKNKRRKRRYSEPGGDKEVVSDISGLDQTVSGDESSIFVDGTKGNDSSAAKDTNSNANVSFDIKSASTVAVTAAPKNRNHSHRKQSKITKSVSASVLEGKVSQFNFVADVGLNEAKNHLSEDGSAVAERDVDRSPSKLIVVEKDVTDDSIVVEESEQPSTSRQSVCKGAASKDGSPALLSPKFAEGSAGTSKKRNSSGTSVCKNPQHSKKNSKGKALAKPARQNKKAPMFRYGNYNQYYGYRNPGNVADLRLSYISPRLLYDRDVLDIGCNVGHVTLSVARDFSPRRVVGLDIDKKLINIARKNIKHYTKTNRELLQGKKDQEYPHSFVSLYKDIPSKDDIEDLQEELAALSKEKKSNEKQKGFRKPFPKNVSFICANFVPECDEFLEIVRPEYDVVLCLSVTKWVHLNHGDEGLKRFFRRIFLTLKPGGLFILEPQPWSSYGKRKKLTPEIFSNYKSIKLKPDMFENFLLREVGFSECHHLATPSHMSRGFERPMQMYIKEDEANSETRLRSFDKPSSEIHAHEQQSAALDCFSRCSNSMSDFQHPYQRNYPTFHLNRMRPNTPFHSSHSNSPYPSPYPSPIPEHYHINPFVSHEEGHVEDFVVRRCRPSNPPFPASESPLNSSTPNTRNLRDIPRNAPAHYSSPAEFQTQSSPDNQPVYDQDDHRPVDSSSNRLSPNSPPSSQDNTATSPENKEPSQQYSPFSPFYKPNSPSTPSATKSSSFSPVYTVGTSSPVYSSPLTIGGRRSPHRSPRLSSTSYAPSSPNIRPSSSNSQSPDRQTSRNNNVPVSPSYSPSSPLYSPAHPVYNPSSPTYRPPSYSPAPHVNSATSSVYSTCGPSYRPSSSSYRPLSPTYSPSPSGPPRPSSPLYSPSSPSSYIPSIFPSSGRQISPLYSPSSPSYSPTSMYSAAYSYGPSSPVYGPQSCRPSSPAYRPSPTYSHCSPSHYPSSSYSPSSSARRPPHSSPSYSPSTSLRASSQFQRPFSPAYSPNSPTYNSNENDSSPAHDASSPAHDRQPSPTHDCINEENASPAYNSSPAYNHDSPVNNSASPNSPSPLYQSSPNGCQFEAASSSNYRSPNLAVASPRTEGSSHESRSSSCSPSVSQSPNYPFVSPHPSSASPRAFSNSPHQPSLGQSAIRNRVSYYLPSSSPQSSASPRPALSPYPVSTSGVYPTSSHFYSSSLFSVSPHPSTSPHSTTSPNPSAPHLSASPLPSASPNPSSCPLVSPNHPPSFSASPNPSLHPSVSPNPSASPHPSAHPSNSPNESALLLPSASPDPLVSSVTFRSSPSASPSESSSQVNPLPSGSPSESSSQVNPLPSASPSESSSVDRQSEELVQPTSATPAVSLSNYSVAESDVVPSAPQKTKDQQSSFADKSPCQSSLQNENLSSESQYLSEGASHSGLSLDNGEQEIDDVPSSANGEQEIDVASSANGEQEIDDVPSSANESGVGNYVGENCANDRESNQEGNNDDDTHDDGEVSKNSDDKCSTKADD